MSIDENQDNSKCGFISSKQIKKLFRVNSNALFVRKNKMNNNKKAKLKTLMNYIEQDFKHLFCNREVFLIHLMYVM